MRLTNLRNRDRVQIVEPGRLHPAVTFNRSTTATYMGGDGLLKTAAVNQPRFEYDAAGNYLGLLIEEGRTNVLLNSATLATQSVTVTAAARTLSYYGTGSVTLSGAATGTLTGTGANNRVTLTFTPTAGTLTLTVSGTVTNAQLEAGAFATSYIPTTGASVTRGADAAVLTPLSKINFSQTAGTFFAQYDANNDATSNRAPFAASDGTNSNRIHTFTAQALSFNVLSGNTFHGISGNYPISDFTNQRVALAYQANDLQGAYFGNVTTVDTSATIPTVNRIYIGAAATGAAGQLNGHVKRLWYTPRRLTSTELQALTA